MTSQVAVAAPNEASAQAALDVTDGGGTAVDAAVAAMLVAMVTEPGIVSLAGGAFLTVWPAGVAEAVTVDGYVAMPGRDLPAGAEPRLLEVSTDYGGGVTMGAGHASVAVPGAPAALALAVSRWGALPWAEVLAPARDVSATGFVVGAAAGYYLPYVRESLLAWDAETATCLRHPDGSWVETGDHVRIPHLAETLDLLAEEGARGMYAGALAEQLADDMLERGGLVTRADLTAYRPLVRPALGVHAGRWALRTNPAPAIGGAVLVAMLTLLGRRPRAAWREEDVARLVEVQRHVLGARRDRLDLADDRTAAVAALLEEVGHRATGSPSTVQVSVVDDAGSACSVTASSGYGSGASVPGTGLWLNNCLGELELNRGGALTVGDRLRSNMAPTVGRDDDGAALAVGSPGADRITTALLQVLAPFAHAGVTLQEAVDRPRLHVVHLEDGSVRVEAEEDLPLPSTGLPVRRHQAHSMYFGGVAAALRRVDGGLDAAADPRRAGVTRVSPVRG